MSLATLIAADVSAVILNTDDFAEAVTRYPLGVTASGAATTAVFFEDEPVKSEQGGEEVIRGGRLFLASSVTVDPRDSWLIRSLVWQCAGVESADTGSKIVRVERSDRISTQGNEGLRLL